jgi:hypothetical protein
MNFNEKYIKYKNKYLNLKKLYGGSSYTLKNSVQIHKYKYSNYTFIMCFNNKNIDYYKRGTIVFIKRKGTLNNNQNYENSNINHNNNLRSIITIREYKDLVLLSEKFNKALVYFLQYYKRTYLEHFELFFPCFSNSNDRDCLSLDHPMFLNLFNSSYNRDCNVQNPPPWHNFSTITYLPSSEWTLTDNIILNDSYNTQCDCIYNTTTKTELLYISSIYDNTTSVHISNPNVLTKPNNNICNLPKFISGNNSRDYYKTELNTIIEYICQTHYSLFEFESRYNLHSTFGIFRGLQIQWMHFKIKPKNYFLTNFHATSIEYYIYVILPLLERSSRTSSSSTIALEGGFTEKIENKNKNNKNKNNNENNIKMDDTFDLYDINKIKMINDILNISNSLKINITEKIAALLYYRLEDDILDELTLKIKFNIINHTFFEELIKLKNKYFNTKNTLENYQKDDILINNLKNIDLIMMTDNFVLDIKNFVHIMKNNEGKIDENRLIKNLNIIAECNDINILHDDILNKILGVIRLY